MDATDLAPTGPIPLYLMLSDASLVSFLLCTASQMAVIPSSLMLLFNKLSSVSEALT